jgi:hypothetical protein
MIAEKSHNVLGQDPITSRQIDELIGLARGLSADGVINPSEVEFLQKWLAANVEISSQPLVRRLYDRVNAILLDGVCGCRQVQGSARHPERLFKPGFRTWRGDEIVRSAAM